MSTTRQQAPVVEGRRVCKECKENKLIDEYYSRHNCISQTCISCFNIKRKAAYRLKKEEQGIELRNLKVKKCLSCGVEKERTIDNYTTRGRNFSNICRACTDDVFESIKQNKINKGPLPESSTRLCTRCMEDKLIGEFYYSVSHQVYRDPCKKCWGLKYYNSEKRKNWSSGNVNRATRLLSSYRVFDIKRGLEYGLSKEYINDQLQKSCTYCGYPATGLDRIDNTKGHTDENCIPCCWECNTARMSNFTVDEMRIIGRGIKEVKDNRYKTTTV